MRRASIGADGTIYFGNDDGTFFALDSDGNLIWNYHIGAPWEFGNDFKSSPAIGADGKIYIGSAGTDGKLYAFGDPAPIPKPSTMALLCFGLISIIGIKRIIN